MIVIASPTSRVSKIMPKKASELAVVNSESEDDEEEGSDNLNCAINLNDSFICTPSKIMFTPLKLPEPTKAEVVRPHQPIETRADPQPVVVQKSSIFSLTSRSSSVQENDKNLVNLPVKKDFAAELEKLALNDHRPPPVMIKSQSTSALGVSQSSSTLALKKKLNDDHVDIIRYRPINQKRVQQQKRDQVTASSWRKSNEFNSGDSGISSHTKFLPSSSSTTSSSTTNSTEAVPPDRSNPVLMKVPSEPVFATPGFQKVQPMQLVASKRLTNPRLPMSSATKCQSTIKEEFQQRKVLFTTPMGGSCKPVSSMSSALPLDDSIMAHRLPDVSEVAISTNEPVKKVDVEEEKKREKKNSGESGSDRRQVRRIKNQDYAVEKKIGHGGSSTVFLGRRLDTGQEVALKVVDLQGDDAIIRGYLKETELLASLQGNPNIITLFD